jgi:hypothetical protein
MEEMDQRENGIVYSKSVRAGKRTYFFDVRVSKNGEKYLVIAESKKKLDPETGALLFEKHKLFLYHEDFENFTEAFNGTINFIQTGEIPEDVETKDKTLVAAEEPVEYE